MRKKEILEGMDLLDLAFYQIPNHYRQKMRAFGIYDMILDGTIKDSAELYLHLPTEILLFQNEAYEDLAQDLLLHLRNQPTLQIGCGAGGLLSNLAKRGVISLVGVDQSPRMINRAKEKVELSNKALFICEDALKIDYKMIPFVRNVLLINFWGILNVQDSIKLLCNIREGLPKLEKIIIGDFQKNAGDKKVINATDLLARKYHFHTRYPHFMNFALCGYTANKLMIANKPYYCLYPDNFK